MPLASDPILELLCCPSCCGDLVQRESGLDCSRCAHAFRASDGIPQLYWPTESGGSRMDVTEEIRAFYEKTPFPDYDEFDSVGSLVSKARRGIFAKLLDDQIPAGARILE